MHPEQSTDAHSPHVPCHSLISPTTISSWTENILPSQMTKTLFYPRAVCVALIQSTPPHPLPLSFSLSHTHKHIDSRPVCHIWLPKNNNTYVPFAYRARKWDAITSGHSRCILMSGVDGRAQSWPLWSNHLRHMFMSSGNRCILWGKKTTLKWFDLMCVCLLPAVRRSSHSLATDMFEQHLGAHLLQVMTTASSPWLFVFIYNDVV